ncbi:MAG: Rap1a/Tai family immunity protein [Candidatus Binatia bacterium]|nr:Rap1a/Tai family immunity protein [Candidatus Binatia bacterium]
MKRMFGWMLVVALLAPVSAEAVDTEDFHIKEAQDLVDVCTTPKTDPLYEAAMGFCHGYCVGAWDYYQAAGRKFVCIPAKPPTRQQAVDGFIDWSATHPEYMQEGAVQALFKYLAGAYACTKE